MSSRNATTLTSKDESDKRHDEGGNPHQKDGRDGDINGWSTSELFNDVEAVSLNDVIFVKLRRTNRPAQDKTLTEAHPDHRDEIAQTGFYDLSPSLLCQGRKGLADGGNLLEMYADTHACCG